MKKTAMNICAISLLATFSAGGVFAKPLSTVDFKGFLKQGSITGLSKPSPEYLHFLDYPIDRQPKQVAIGNGTYKFKCPVQNYLSGDVNSSHSQAKYRVLESVSPSVVKTDDLYPLMLIFERSSKLNNDLITICSGKKSVILNVTFEIDRGSVMQPFLRDLKE